MAPATAWRSTKDTNSHEGPRCVRSGSVKSGQVLSSRVKSFFPAIGDGRSGCLLAVDARRPDGSCRGPCVLRSWFSVSCSSLLQPVVNISVAHLKVICPGFSHFSPFFVMNGSFWPLVPRKDQAAVAGGRAMFCTGHVVYSGGDSVSRAGHGHSIACAAVFCGRIRKTGQFSMFVHDFSWGSLFKRGIIERGADWIHGRIAGKAFGQNLRVSLTRQFGRGLSRNEIFFLLDSRVVPESFG